MQKRIDETLDFAGAAAGAKTILHTWLDKQPPLFKLFLDKLAYLIKMYWVEASLHTEKKVKYFFKV